MGQSLLRAIGQREPIYELRHKNSENEYIKFIRYMTVSRNVLYILAVCLVIIAAGMFVLHTADKVVGAVILGCAVALPAIMLTAAYANAKRYLKKNGWYTEYENEYKFFDDILYIRSDNGKRFTESVIAYENLNKIIETYNNFYIFIDKARAVIVDKKPMDKAFYARFKDFILGRMPDGGVKGTLGFKIKRRKDNRLKK